MPDDDSKNHLFTQVKATPPMELEQSIYLILIMNLGLLHSKQFKVVKFKKHDPYRQQGLISPIESIDSF